MDRYLVSGALLLLILEVGILLNELDVIQLTSTRYESQNQTPIGELTSSYKQVRRRSQKSLIWEDTQIQQSLFAFDSILTLKNSRAQVQLENNVKLKIYENTLVVLEPTSEKQGDRIRVNFRRGNLLSKSQKSYTLGAGNWTIDAESGSELSLKSREEGKIELEIEGGSVTVLNKTSQQSLEFQQGQRLQLGADQVEDQSSLLEDLEWVTPNNYRLYSHTFPAQAPLEWKGPAQQIEYYKPGEESQIFDVQGYFKKSLPLDAGTYFFVMKNSQGESSSLSIHLIPAPRLRHFSPLPRDRIDVQSPQTFSWQSHPLAAQYELELRTPAQESVEKVKSHNNILTQTMNREGLFHWQINFYDDEGYKVPAAFFYPLYFVRDPLPAPEWIRPQLKPPPVRRPADEPKKAKDSKNESHLHSIWSTLCTCYWVLYCSPQWLKPKLPRKKSQKHKEFTCSGRRSPWLIFTSWKLPAMQVFRILYSTSEFTKMNSFGTTTSSKRFTLFAWLAVHATVVWAFLVALSRSTLMI